MANQYDSLPGGCVVNQLRCQSVQTEAVGIFIESQLLKAFGFSPEQAVSMVVMKGRIVIVSDPNQQKLLSGIQELQLRQDELKQDFTPAIQVMLSLV